MAFAVVGCAAIFGPFLYFAWPRGEEPETDEVAATEDAEPEVGVDGLAPAVVDRERATLFQPVLVWSDDSVTVQGTGFVVEHGGRSFAVTSSHFIAPSPTPLARVALGSIPKLDKLTTTPHAWGPMGPALGEHGDDFRDDYLVMPIDAVDLQSLELDSREVPQVGEDVWFPDKSDDVDYGHVVRTGRVTAATLGVVEVALDEPITLESQSGTPVLSARTNRVLGILGGADSEQGKRLFFTPASVLRSVLDDGDREPTELLLSLPQWSRAPTGP
ncbi:MAG: hypothetical protein AAF799_47940 [Myxococcota bacterium]